MAGVIAAVASLTKAIVDQMNPQAPETLDAFRQGAEERLLGTVVIAKEDQDNNNESETILNENTSDYVRGVSETSDSLQESAYFSLPDQDYCEITQLETCQSEPKFQGLEANEVELSFQMKDKVKTGSVGGGTKMGSGDGMFHDAKDFPDGGELDHPQTVLGPEDAVVEEQMTISYGKGLSDLQALLIKRVQDEFSPDFNEHLDPSFAEPNKGGSDRNCLDTVVSQLPHPDLDKTEEEVVAITSDMVESENNAIDTPIFESLFAPDLTQSLDDLLERLHLDEELERNRSANDLSLPDLDIPKTVNEGQSVENSNWKSIRHLIRILQTFVDDDPPPNDRPGRSAEVTPVPFSNPSIEVRENPISKAVSLEQLLTSKKSGTLSMREKQRSLKDLVHMLQEKVDGLASPAPSDSDEKRGEDEERRDSEVITEEEVRAEESDNIFASEISVTEYLDLYSMSKDEENQVRMSNEFSDCELTPEPEGIEEIEDSIQAKASSLSNLSLGPEQGINSMEFDTGIEEEESSSPGPSINLSRRYEDLIQKQMRMSGGESDGAGSVISEHNTSSLQNLNGDLDGEVSLSRTRNSGSSRLSSCYRGASEPMLHKLHTKPRSSILQPSGRFSEDSYERPPSRHSDYSDRPVESTLSSYSDYKSMPSEPELNGYDSRGKNGSLHVPRVNAWSDRPGSSNSMPSVSQRFPPPDHRSLTPETRLSTRSLSMKPPLVTSRTTPLGSHGSSRTMTPAPYSGSGSESEGGRPSRLQELEDTLISLKHSLDEKEMEIRHLHTDISDLRSENRLLNNQLQDGERSHRRINGHDEDFNRVLAEKENLATELFKLRSQLSQNGKGDRISIDSYDPDNPEVLKNKLADLQSQVQDLHEANESTSSEVNKAEKRIAELLQENESLQTLGGVSVDDIQAENQYLRQQVERLNERNSKLLNNADDRQRDEMHALRSDLRTLRERNQQVNEENIRLREELRELRLRSDERDRKFRHGARSPKFHDTDLGVSDRYTNGLDGADSRYRSNIEDFVPHYSGYTTLSPARSASKISDQLSPADDPKNYSTLHTYSPPTKDYHSSLSPKYSSPLRADHSLRGSTKDLYSKREHNDEREKYGPMLTDRSDSTVYLTSSVHTKPYGVETNLSDTELAEMTESYLRPTHSKSPATSKSDTSQQHKATPSYYVDDVSPSRKHRYSNHFDDDSSSTSSILSEVERELLLISSGSRKHNRSRSFEPKKSRGRSISPSDSRILSPVGFRSVSPNPTVTQHNKATLGYPSKKSILSTSGKRPFAPRGPADVTVGAVVKFSRQNGKISKGVVRYVGHLPGRNDTYLGLELENEAGKHDGTYNNQRFFHCKPNKGVFVAFNKIVMCWA